jgi:biotin transport system substrate-specific component
MSMAAVPLVELRNLVLASLMAALTAVGAYVQIPLGPVPMVLQNLFVLLAGLLLGARWGSTSIAVYVLVGVCGLPVFAGGKGGLAVLAGPTGGYLFGFVAAALVAGWIAHYGRPRMIMDVLAVAVGSLVIYCLGFPWLKLVTGWSWDKVLAVGVAPFVLGDIVKAAAAIMLAGALRPMMDRINTLGLAHDRH